MIADLGLDVLVFADVDSSDFADGFMTVSLTANGHAHDRLSIRNQGSALNQIGVGGGQVSYSGVVIGTFVGGTSGLDPLQITFNAGASKAAVQALVRNLTFSNIAYAVFKAEFNPVPAQCTGRFANVKGGRFLMTAVTEPFDLRNPVNVRYCWEGEGTLEFAKR